MSTTMDDDPEGSGEYYELHFGPIDETDKAEITRLLLVIGGRAALQGVTTHGGIVMHGFTARDAFAQVLLLIPKRSVVMTLKNTFRLHGDTGNTCEVLLNEDYGEGNHLWMVKVKSAEIETEEVC